MTDKLWTTKEVVAFLNVSTRTFAWLKHTANFPKPAPGLKHPRWVPEIVKNWAASQNS